MNSKLPFKSQGETDNPSAKSAQLSHFLKPYAQPALVGGIVLGCCLFGILIRPVGFLKTFWPANAVLLGLMVRYPQWNRLSCWLAALAGYLTANLVTGVSLGITCWLTAANMIGVLTGVSLLHRLPEQDRQLSRPVSVLYLFFICAAAAIVAAVTTAGISQILFDRSWLMGFGFWFSTELVNSMLILPVLLTAPSLREILEQIRNFRKARRKDRRVLAPAASLVLSAIISVIVGGPGAIIFPVPALLWCALSYSLFSTAVLTCLLCVWKMIAVSTEILVIHPSPTTDYLAENMSIRLGIALLALGPLTVASINAARNELLATLNRAIRHDSLTDALTRGAFMQLAVDKVAQHIASQSPLVVMMLDVDHFKKVNDVFGHLAGDQVLVKFTQTISSSLRKTDLFGRLGGEEFSIVMPHVNAEQGTKIAERLRAAIEQMTISLPDGQPVQVTVSIGLTFLSDNSHPTFQHLLATADKALYIAKSQGRNRIHSLPHEERSAESEEPGE